jgi:hypothetical protein
MTVIYIRQQGTREQQCNSGQPLVPFSFQPVVTSTWLIIVIMCHIPLLRNKPSTHSAAAEPSRYRASTAGNGVMLWTKNPLTHTRSSNLLYWFLFHLKGLVNRPNYRINFKFENSTKIKQTGSTCRNVAPKCIIHDVANFFRGGRQGGHGPYQWLKSILQNERTYYMRACYPTIYVYYTQALKSSYVLLQRPIIISYTDQHKRPNSAKR